MDAIINSLMDNSNRTNASSNELRTSEATDKLYDCNICQRSFSSTRGLSTHHRACAKNNKSAHTSSSQPIAPSLTAVPVVVDLPLSQPIVAELNHSVDDEVSAPEVDIVPIENFDHNREDELLDVIVVDQVIDARERIQFPALDLAADAPAPGYDKNYFKRQVQDIYEKIVYWRKNTFELPKGKTGREFILEITDWIKKWNNKSEFRDISFKVVFVMHALLLQQSNRKNKAKKNKEILSRRLMLWKESKLTDLFNEAQVIQSRLKQSVKTNIDSDSLDRKFRNLITSGNVSGALRLLDSNPSSGLLDLNDDTIKLLHEKHPKAKPFCERMALNAAVNPERKFDPIIFDDVTPELIQRIALQTKGSAGPSQANADDWKRIIGSTIYKSASDDLRCEIAELTRQLCVEKLTDPESIEALMACRLVPLNKDPGLRPIGIGEVLRRIIGKAVTTVCRTDIQVAAGGLQLCAGIPGGVEAGIHSLRQMFEDDDAHGLIQVDANNAFNSINRQVLLHNIKFICPEIATFVHNCYVRPARLFVTGGIEIASEEGSTQGDPVAMPLYLVGVTPLLGSCKTEGVKHAAFADDVNSAGFLAALRIWWDKVVELGPYIGYDAKASKSWLIVKPEYYEDAKRIFEGSGLNITVDGKRLLGANIGSIDFKLKYVEDAVTEWVHQVNTLASIAKTEPHAAYSGFVHGLQHKFTFIMRTVPDISQQLRVLDEAIDTFISCMLTTPYSSSDRKLFALPVKLGGLGILIPSEVSDRYYTDSLYVSRSITDNVYNQVESMQVDFDDIKARKHFVESEKTRLEKEAAESISVSLSSEQRKRLECITEDGASSWLTALPLRKYGFFLDKQSFRDALFLRYGYRLSKLPATCVCGFAFSAEHALSCGHGGFVIMRHNDVRDITADLLKLACNDVEIEPELTPLTGENFKLKTTNTSDEARVDVSARGFWTKGKKLYGDVKIFNPLAKSYKNTSLKNAHRSNEQGKKRNYNQRIINVEHGTFTPLVFSSFGGASYETTRFLKRLNELIAAKRGESTSTSMHYIRTLYSFSLLRSTLLCIRGSRSHKKRSVEIKDVDISVATNEFTS